MEDTLRESYATALKAVGSVLILVLMEDTLRAQQSSWATTEYEVLILVLMEDTLRGISVCRWGS